MNFAYISGVEFDLDLLIDVNQAVEQQRVELTAFAVKYHFQSSFVRERLLIYTLAYQRVVNVRKGYQLRRDRYLVALEPVRLSPAVPAFVVPAAYFVGYLDELLVLVLFQAFYHLRADDRVGLHYLELLGS